MSCNHQITMTIKPKLRYKIPKKCLKSSRDQAISGKKNPLRCRFCGLYSNIPTSMISNISVCLTDKDMEKYCSLFNHFHSNIGKIDFDNGQLENSVLIDGITRLVHHIIFHGFFKYQSIGFPNTIIVGIHFLVWGGIALTD